MTARPSADQQHRPFEIAIVGNDLLLAALPGRPLQVAHAIHACGYDLVVPVSWGEELVATHALEALGEAGARTMVFCACPKVRSRLVASGTELLPHLITCVSPPAAAARYLRALEPGVRMRVTYIGGCPGAVDTSIDARIMPADFLAYLERRGIPVTTQPLVFESVIPPDRRRHLSFPGGMPAPESLAERGYHFSLLLEETDLAAEIGEHLIAADRVLLDVAPAVGCVCAGSLPGGSREAILALEPPHAPLPVIERDVPVSLHAASMTVPAPDEHSHSAVSAAPALARAHEDPVRAGVHSIEAAARRRAERGRIAVTPPGVRAAQPPLVPAPARVTPVEPTTMQGRADPLLEPTPGETDVTAAPTPETVAAPSTVPQESPPMPMPSDLDTPTTLPPALPDTTDVDIAPAPTVVVRRRTPVYSVWHSSRATAHQRVVERQGTTMPRAYSAIRQRSGEFVAVVGQVEAGETPIPVDREVAMAVTVDQATVVPARSAAPNATAFEPEPHRTGRRSSRRVEAHGVPRRSRLWGLLMSIILITAVTVTLLLIFGG